MVIALLCCCDQHSCWAKLQSVLGTFPQSTRLELSKTHFTPTTWAEESSWDEDTLPPSQRSTKKASEAHPAHPAEDAASTHLSSLLPAPQLRLLETPKSHPEECWDLWMCQQLLVNAAHPKLARRSGRIICQLLVCSSILAKMSQLH